MMTAAQAKGLDREPWKRRGVLQHEEQSVLLVCVLLKKLPVYLWSDTFVKQTYTTMESGKAVSLWGVICIMLFVPVAVFCQHNVSLIPKPNQITVGKGTYVFPAFLQVHTFDIFHSATDLLKDIPGIDSLGVNLVRSARRMPEQGIRLIRATPAHKLHEQAYRLQVDSTGIQITAHREAEMINGIMTLLQLACIQENVHEIPQLTIEDQPRFVYRGLHLDVSRHFFPISFLKKFIDVMALYKFNNFHWHLTDDPGWRLEIKKYPELTQKAAWRTHRDWKEWKNNGGLYLQEGHPNAHGGYYTQQEARDLVAYAKKKGINIIPEIEMPGHSEAVLATYPQMTCTGEAHKHAEFCIGNEQTFTFLTDVLEEVVDIFPSPYIHIGGDEADKKSWRNCPKCQERLEKEGLEDEDALQSYAVQRMNDFIKSKGRRLIGWDEIMEGGLPAGATVMSWRGEQAGIDAAHAGHDVIMTPESHLYFDYYQSDPRTQPEAIGGYTTLEKVYSYNPLPEALAKDKIKHLLGAQANVWTEYMPTQEHVEYMAFPRALALSEVLWTDQNEREWEEFSERLRGHYRLLQRFDVNYYRPSYTSSIHVQYNPEVNANTISIISEQHEPTIHYTIDGEEPSVTSSLYKKSFDLSVPATVKAACFIDSVRVGPVAVAQVDVHKAIGKKVVYNNTWDSYPAQAEATLTNGQKGELHYGDGQWQGFLNDVDVTIDFERREEINSFAIRFMQLRGPGIFMPGEVKILLSDNGKNYREAATITHNISNDDPSLIFHTFEKAFEKPHTARYVRVIATNVNNAFLFTDEIVVY